VIHVPVLASAKQHHASDGFATDSSSLEPKKKHLLGYLWSKAKIEAFAWLFVELSQKRSICLAVFEAKPLAVGDS
jgi:hypothetical protein